MLFIRKIMYCQLSGCTRSQHRMLVCRPKCTRLHLVRSSALNCLEFPQRRHKSDGLGLCRKHGCTWSALDCDSWARAQMCSIASSLCSIVVALDRISCALDRTNRDHFLFYSFPPFKPHFQANDL
jgi:hypothetical protein